MIFCVGIDNGIDQRGRNIGHCHINMWISTTLYLEAKVYPISSMIIHISTITRLSKKLKLEGAHQLSSFLKKNLIIIYVIGR